MKDEIKLGIITFVSLILITFPYIGLLSVILSLIYLIFIFMPFLIVITRMKIGFIEKFVLTNFAGLSYSTFTLLLDSVLKIKLTKFVFILIPAIIFIAGIKYKGGKR